MPRCEHREPGGVRDDRLLEADLRAVGEGRDHGRLLPPLAPRTLLGGRVAIGVLQALHVADHARVEPEALHPAVQVHLHARLVAVAGRQDDAVLARRRLQDGADRRVDLGVHQHDVLAVTNASSTTCAPNSTSARHVADDVDLLARQSRNASSVTTGRPGPDRVLECTPACAASTGSSPAYRRRWRPLGIPVGDRRRGACRARC